MSKIINIFAIDNYKQEANYVWLPKSLNDKLNINFPEIVYEIFWDWIITGNKKLLYYKSNNSKYSFINAYVFQYFHMINRYGMQSLDVYVGFDFMSHGIRK